MNNNLGYSDDAWNRINDREKHILLDVMPIRRPTGIANYRLLNIESQLEQFDTDFKRCDPNGGLVLNPDFQRGYSWTREQQISFIENLLRGTASLSIKMNDTSDIPGGDLPPYSLICIDGLQRLTALREFMAGEFKIFSDKYGPEIISNGPPEFRNKTWQMEMYSFSTRKDIMEYYLAFNSGGTVHSPEDLNKVKRLLNEIEAPAPAKKKTRGLTP